MKKSSSFFRILSFGLAMILFITSCKKENSEALSAQEEEQAALYATESETEAEMTFDDVYDNVMGVNSEVGVGGVGIFGRVAIGRTGEASRVDSLPSCVTVSVAPILPGVFPKTVTVDFGTGCMSHGRLRSGKIKTVYSGPLREAGSVATTTFENFKIDSISVTGTHKITNTTATTPGANQRQFKIEVINGKLARPNGDYTERDATRTITQIEGNGTISPADDILSVRGGAQGRVKRGSLIVLWNSEITEPLLKKFTCRWISKGRVRTVRQGLAANSPWVAILDYVTGSCDNQAALTINGNTRQITLK